MGYALHSKQDWSKDDMLGAHLGELLPTRSSNPDYCHEVFIGPDFSKTRPTIAYIDAEKCGDYTWFCDYAVSIMRSLLSGEWGGRECWRLRQ
jgi:hypothetical protein